MLPHAGPAEDEYTYPPGLRDEIAGSSAPYRTDVRNFRGDDRDRILAEIYEMTEQHSRWPGTSSTPGRGTSS